MFENCNNHFSGTVMKSFLLTLLPFFIFACGDKNAPDIQREDYSMLNKASKNVISVMGKSKTAAEKKILNAGFRIADTDIYEATEKRLHIPAAAKEDEEQVCYVYNISQNMDDLEEEEIINDIIDSKKTAVIFLAVYSNGILININGKMIVGAEIDFVNNLYLDCSSNLHKNITKLGSWQGSVQESQEDSDLTDYTSYKDFYKAVEPMNSVFAFESAGCALDLTGLKSFGYALSWDKPDEDKARFQINNEGYKTAIAEAAFSISYMDYTKMY